MRNHIAAWILLLIASAAPTWAQSVGEPPVEACKPGNFTVIGYPEEFAPKVNGKFQVVVDEKFRGQFQSPVRNWIPMIADAVPKWNNIEGAKFEFELFDVSPAPADPFDGRTSIQACGTFFACPGEIPFVTPFEPPFPAPFPPGTVAPQGVIAVTLVVSSRDPQKPITDSDIYFNPDIPFSLEPALNQVDFESVLIHELGHALGLGHSDNCTTTRTVMESLINLAERRRNLSDSERAGVRFLYPADSSPAVHNFPSERALRFHAIAGDPPPFEQSVRIFGRNSDNWVATTTTGAGGNWLRLKTSRGLMDPAETLTVLTETQSLAVGTYTGTVAVRAVNHPGPAATVAVTLVVAERGITRPTPFLRSSSIVNGSNLRSRAFAPGGLMTIFGQWLAGGTLQAGAFPLPRNLGGAEVLIGGVKAPVLYASDQQLNVVIPSELPIGPSGVIVRNGLQQSQSFGIELSAAAPEVFLLDERHALALNQDGSLNTSRNPAAQGAVVVVFFTGQGATDQNVAADRPAPRDPLARVTSESSATLAGQAADILYLGLAPDFSGVAQANLVVPRGLSGELVLKLTIAGQTSSVLSTISVE